MIQRKHSARSLKERVHELKIMSDVYTVENLIVRLIKEGFSFNEKFHLNYQMLVAIIKDCEALKNNANIIVNFDEPAKAKSRQIHSISGFKVGEDDYEINWQL